jgi:hypothetical protein
MALALPRHRYTVSPLGRVGGGGRWGSIFVELIASVKRGMDVLKFVLWRMTPCGFLGVKAADEK